MIFQTTELGEGNFSSFSSSSLPPAPTLLCSLKLLKAGQEDGMRRSQMCPHYRVWAIPRRRYSHDPRATANKINRSRWRSEKRTTQSGAVTVIGGTSKGT